VCAGDVGVVGEREARAQGDGGVVVVCGVEAGACGGGGGEYVLFRFDDARSVAPSSCLTYRHY